MKRWFASFIFISIICAATVAAAKGPEVDLVDNKLSINADSISLGRLIQLVDMATGMKSKVPAELANRNLSVRFSSLTLSDGFRKIFQGQPLDYVVIQGQGIVVTAPSQAIAGAVGGGGDSLQQFNQPPQMQPIDQPFVQEFPPVQPMPIQQQQQGQPAMVQTPFGPIPNPRAQQQMQQPNAPLTAPGQQNSLFPQAVPSNQPQAVPNFQMNNPTPFGTPSTFGAPNNQQPVTNPNNGLFAPPPGFQQR